MKIRFLKAFKGDSILITVNTDMGPRNILVDGGEGATYKKDIGPVGIPEYGELKTITENLRNQKQKIDLLILTHIDDDHIGGILKWLAEDEGAHELIREIWFNSGRMIARSLGILENKDLENRIDTDESTDTSVAQGIKFGKYIKAHGIKWHEQPILQGQELKRYGLTFKIISPEIGHLKRLLKEWKKKEPDLDTAAKSHDYAMSLRDHVKNDVFEKDRSIPNASSIAFIMQWKDKNFLFLADAYSSVVEDGLKVFTAEEKLKYELVKLAHHGSAGNMSADLIDKIDCQNFVISTNGDRHYHPHKRLLARLIDLKPNSNLYFNYYKKGSKPEIFSKYDYQEYPFNVFEIEKEFEFV
ncbi:MBL fold metallo-hydrolase [Flavobacteriaceae bacterium TP-CH-4]|uniref:MBL fold metallo-hydrolase n=1 Tax=Pelagihabitans pacificus TaxID=2696054 RepID=A0A967E5F7_9FLAO|nr:MBL fold metallo-hydrolase [Pelagihabitans pacificus]NHF58039.1 MBL fold metallo-hydrolase [Pelagihabitans pacificus]